MNCKQCGQPLPEGTVFCSVCGAKQDVAVQSSAQPQIPPQAQPQMYYEVKVKQKKKKNPIVPVILNLIAAVLFYSMTLYSVYNDQPEHFSNSLFYIFLFPLLFSIVILWVKNNIIKLISSIMELIVALIIGLNIWNQLADSFIFFMSGILMLAASFYSISYVKNLKNYPNLSFNNKAAKSLSIISCVVVIGVVASGFAIKSYAQLQYVKEKFYDGNYTEVAEWLEKEGNTKGANELIVWSKFQSICEQNHNAAEDSLIRCLKDPGSFISYGSTLNYSITKSGNENEVIVEGSVKIDYSATNSFGGRLTDTYLFECPKRTLDTLGLSKEEVEEIVALSKNQILDRCLQQNT